MNSLCVLILFLQLFISLKLFPKKNVKTIVPPPPQKETKAKQQRTFGDRGGADEKESKEVIQRGERTPGLGVVTAMTRKSDPKEGGTQRNHHTSTIFLILSGNSQS